MPITFECPSCLSPITVKDTLAGKKGSCKKCGNAIEVPSQVGVVSARRIPSTPIATANTSHQVTLGSQIPGEFTIWKANASQIENVGKFIFLGIVALVVLIAGFSQPLLWLIIPIPMLSAFGYWINTNCKLYELTNQRFRLSHGVFSKTTEDIELFRVKDTKLFVPFFYRLFGKGNIGILSSDLTQPMLVIEAVDKPADLRETMRAHVNEQRQAKGVREVDAR